MGAAARKSRQAPRPTVAKAVAHPIRATCLVMMAERPTSSSEVARYLCIKDMSAVHYHTEALAEAGLIEEVRTRQVRGATEHFYRAIERPITTAEEEAELDKDERCSWAETIISLFAANATHALEKETLIARTDHHLTRLTMNVDDEGWEEMAAAYMELYERVEEIKVATAKRLRRSPNKKATRKKPTRVISFQAMFPIPDIRPNQSGGPAPPTSAS